MYVCVNIYEHLLECCNFCVISHKKREERDRDRNGKKSQRQSWRQSKKHGNIIPSLCGFK